MKSENTPSQSSIAANQTIEFSTRFGGLSRGKCWGKYYPHQKRATGEWSWVEKDSSGTLFLTGPGFYVVGSSDGFNRTARGEFYLPSKASVAAKERAEKALRTPEEEIALLETKIVEHNRKIENSALKGLDTTLVLTADVGSLQTGKTVTRAKLVEERNKIIAEFRNEIAKLQDTSV